MLWPLLISGHDLPGVLSCRSPVIPARHRRTRPSRHRVGRRTRPPHHSRLNWKGVASREGQGGTVKRTFQRAASRFVTVVGLGFLLATAAFIGAMPSAAASRIGVCVAY